MTCLHLPLSLTTLGKKAFQVRSSVSNGDKSEHERMRTFIENLHSIMKLAGIYNLTGVLRGGQYFLSLSLSSLISG